MTGNTEKRVVLSGFNGTILKKFSKYSVVIGALFSILGLLGLVVPQVLSLVASAFLGWLLLGAGVLSLYLAFLTQWRSVIAWVKAFLLLFTGALVLFNPLAGILAVALLLALYLFMDAFANFALAQHMYPMKGWGWMAANGVVSLGLGLIMTFGWPANTVVLVGLYLGISLLFDGITLVMMGLAAKKFAD